MLEAEAFSTQSLSTLYADFAAHVAGESDDWRQLCDWIANNQRLWPLLSTLPGNKRQPNLFLAALRYLGAPTSPPLNVANWVEDNWSAVQQIALARSTQTNEPGRCAILAPVLASLPEPIALIEVGMSAGLCLIPDRYDYDWIGASPQASPTEQSQSSPVRLRCTVSGSPAVPLAKPVVAWRGGIDLNPLNASDPDDAKWLRSLIWPGQIERVQRLAAAIQLTAAESIHRVRGDAIEQLPELVAAAPTGATVVVMHSAVLAYFPAGRRRQFVELVQSLPVRWLSNEGERVVPGVDAGAWSGPPSFVMSLDGEPLARTGPHGQFLHWL